MDYKVIKDIVKKKQVLIAFLISFFVIFIFEFLQSPKWDQYFSDSGYYYQLSTTFLKDGSFKFTNYELSFRGYLFPFVLYIYQWIGKLVDISSETSILLGSSLFVSVLFIIVLPDLFTKANVRSVIRLLIPISLFMIFWSDLVYYPLSDLYSYGFLILAIWFIKKIEFNHMIKSSFFSVLSGVLIYAAYNTRTIYLFVIPILILIFIVLNRREEVKKIFLFVFLVCLGTIICSLPQIYINIYQHDQITMEVITNSLVEFQLYTGLYMQRFEGFSGNPPTSPQIMTFIDGVGYQLIQKHSLVLYENFTIVKYFEVAIKNPLDFMGIMARHLINAFHLPYNHVYIRDLDYHKTFFTVFNYSILFIAGIGFLSNIKNRKKTVKFDKNMIYLYVAMIPCIAILPGAIEMRFFIPFYAMIYCFIAYEISYKNVLHNIWKYKIQLFFSYVFILAVLAAVWGSTFNACQLSPQLLGQ